MIIQKLGAEVAQRILQNFQLQVGAISEQLTVNSSNDLLESTTISVDHITNGQMVQNLPLNGWFFLDLGMLAPGSVTPPKTASQQYRCAAVARLLLTPQATAKKQSTTWSTESLLTTNGLVLSAFSHRLTPSRSSRWTTRPSALSRPELRRSCQHCDTVRDPGIRRQHRQRGP